MASKTTTKRLSRMLSLFAAICVAGSAVTTAALAESFTYDRYIELGAESFTAATEFGQTKISTSNGGTFQGAVKDGTGKSRIYGVVRNYDIEYTEADRNTGIAGTGNRIIVDTEEKYLRMVRNEANGMDVYAFYYPTSDTDTFSNSTAYQTVSENRYTVEFKLRVVEATGGSLDFSAGTTYKILNDGTVSIGSTATDTVLTDGQWYNIKIEFSRSSDTDSYKSKLYIDNQLVSGESGDDCGNFQHSYVKFSLGNSYRGEVNIDDFKVSDVVLQDGTETVANEPISAEFKNIPPSGPEINSSDSPLTFELQASAVSGIAVVEAYADGVSLTIAPTAEVTESLVDMGGHYAMCSSNFYSVTVPENLIATSPEVTAIVTSTAGNTAETTLKINYRPTLTKDLVVLQRFENINVDNEGDGILSVPYRGFVGTRELAGSVYGKSLLVSNEYTSINSGNDDQAPRVRLEPVADSSFAGKFVFESKVNVISGDSGGQATLRLYGQSNGKSAYTEIIKFLGVTGGNANKMKIGSSTYAPCQNGSLNEDGTINSLGDWISIKLEIDTPNNLCTVYTSDENGEMVQRGEAIALAGFDSIQYIQIQIIKTQNTNAIAIDDLRMYISENCPSIAVEDEGLIKTADKSVTAVVDGYLNPASISVDSIAADGTEKEGSVKLLDGNGKKIKLESAEYSRGKLTVKPTRKLMSNKSYTIVVTSTAEVSEGLPLGTEIKTTFTVPKENIFVDNVGFSNHLADGTPMKKASVVLSNHLGEAKTVYVVVTAYKNGKQIGFAASEVTVPAGGITATAMVNAEEGATYEVYIYDSLKNLKYIANRLFAQ